MLDFVRICPACMSSNDCCTCQPNEVGRSAGLLREKSERDRRGQDEDKEELYCGEGEDDENDQDEDDLGWGEGEDDEIDKDEDDLGCGEGDSESGLESLGDGRFKIDLTLGIEHVWMWSAIFAAFVIIPVAVGCFRGVLPWNRAAMVAAVLPLSIWLARRTDNYYILDPQRREILYRRAIVSYSSERLLGKFIDVAALTVDGRRRSRRGDVWWEYFVVLVFKDRRSLRLSESERRLAQSNRLAGTVAQLMKVPFHRGKRQRELVIGDRTPAGVPALRHESYSWFRDKGLDLMVVLAYFALLGLLGVVLRAR